MIIEDILKDIDEAVSGDVDSEVLSAFTQLLKRKITLLTKIDINECTVASVNAIGTTGRLTDSEIQRRSRAKSVLNKLQKDLHDAQTEIDNFLDNL